eukprot:GHVR01128212.1.p1 GENE.GHVR01128212.1~~GHVR01128212.1.p1  ORF type:complete len:290 (+),score=60.22 GHVR01128212.1:147-1016(+)
MDYIILDSKIRDFVLIPIFIIVCMAHMLRQNLTVILRNDPKGDPKDLRNSQHITRAKLLNTNAHNIPQTSFEIRRAYYNNKSTGLLSNPPEQKGALEAMASQDPTQAMGMMKQQVVYIFLQGGLAYFVSYVFSGFVVAKTPFPLTYKFKSMLQRGVEVPSLDYTFVSSLSWYFVVLLGAGGIIGLVAQMAGANEYEDDFSTSIAALNPAMGMAGGMGGPPAAPANQMQFEAERQSLEIRDHSFALKDSEGELLKQWKLMIDPQTHTHTTQNNIVRQGSGGNTGKDKKRR